MAIEKDITKKPQHIDSVDSTSDDASSGRSPWSDVTSAAAVTKAQIIDSIPDSTTFNARKQKLQKKARFSAWLAVFAMAWFVLMGTAVMAASAFEREKRMPM
eukprot:5417529-Prymnesium_polylepis.3